ncbi:MAG: type II secretory pathway component HofQ, partial [Yoonia sp.]
DAIKILSENQEANYTQQEAKKALDGNSGEVNTTLMRLAESLVRQQNAAKVTPAAIRASLPTHGHAYGFTRSLQVNKNADLSINLEADIPSSGSNGSFKLLSLLFIGAFVVLMINRKRVEAV